ncbi:MAG TPA: signal peptidase II [Methylovirgula sp.]|jgi:signal peptidase II|nr:signal peptidase II [Methylovirgula sp.]
MKPRTIGFITAVIALILDQANKLWLINVYDIARNQPVRLAPFFDVIFAKNTGISYSLLSAKTPFGRFALVIGALIVVGFLAVWMWRARTAITAIGLGLIIGGALGNNACDRFFYGFVADFYHFHVGGFSWYVFNLADVAITFGVILLLYETLLGDESERQAPRAAENVQNGP